MGEEVAEFQFEQSDVLLSEIFKTVVRLKTTAKTQKNKLCDRSTQDEDEDEGRAKLRKITDHSFVALNSETPSAYYNILNRTE